MVVIIVSRIINVELLYIFCVLSFCTYNVHCCSSVSIQEAENCYSLQVARKSESLLSSLSRDFSQIQILFAILVSDIVSYEYEHHDTNSCIIPFM